MREYVLHSPSGTRTGHRPLVGSERYEHLSKISMVGIQSFNP